MDRTYGEELLAEIDRGAKNTAGLTHRIGDLRNLLERIVDDALPLDLDLPQHFVDSITLARDYLHLPEPIVTAMHRVRKLGNRAVHPPSARRDPLHRKSAPLTEQDYREAVRAMCEIIGHLAGAEPSPTLRQLCANAPDPKTARAPEQELPEHIDSLRIFVTHIKQETQANVQGAPEVFYSLVGETEEYDRITLRLDDHFTRIGQLAWPYCAVQCFNLKRLPHGERLVRTTNDSLIVLEPDYLVDVTAVTKVYGAEQGGDGLLAHLAGKFEAGDVSEPMLIGSVVNDCLDELVSNPDLPLSSALRKALTGNTRTLLGMLRLRLTPRSVQQKIESLYDTMQAFARQLARQHAQCTVEPSFLSESYGLQGRLDLLVEYAHDQARKDIIELKSGSTPSAYTDRPGGCPGIWPEHYSQTVCYDLLLRQPFPDRRGEISILYPRDANFPVRPFEYRDVAVRRVMYARNIIVATERRLRDQHHGLARRLLTGDANGLPSFAIERVQLLQAKLNALSPLDRAYFLALMSFIASEHWLSKLGAHPERDSRGLAALWRDTPERKRERFSLLSGLTYQGPASDSESTTLVFARSTDGGERANFRKGDITVLYPQEPNGTLKPTYHRVLKCSIVSLTRETITVRLMSRYAPAEYLTRHSGHMWAIEHDSLESNYKRLYESLAMMLDAGPAKRAVLLGQSAPRFSSPPRVAAPELTEKQAKAVATALSAQDYYLLQGPPGTGKTSKIIRELVRNLHADPGESILLLAYTNRAVDEICDAIADIQPAIDFILLGHTHAGAHTERTLGVVAAAGSLDDLRSRIRQTQVFVSTVLSYLGTPDLHEMKQFTTAIVDEASQLLEPHLIGPLSRVRRFILIGDHNQLPAVVAQPSDATALNSNREEQQPLLAAGFWNLRVSLFERLWERAREQGWEAEACGTLTEQGRMHEEIQAFPSERFYGPLNDGDRLTPLLPEQRDARRPLHQAIPTDITAEDRALLDLLTRKRVVLIPTDPSGTDQTEQEIEVARVTRITQALHHFWKGGGFSYVHKLDESTIFQGDDLLPRERDEATRFKGELVGILTPWRAQVAAIRHALEQHSFAGLPDDREDGDHDFVDTIERYQGSERHVIIISFAVSHPSQLPNMVDLRHPRRPRPDEPKSIDRKLNVALTRAKDLVILLGNPKALMLSEDQHYLALLGYVSRHGYMFSARDCDVLDAVPALSRG